MITGIVTPEREAFIVLMAQEPDGQAEEVPAVIDTGFDGSLSLPSNTIARLVASGKSRINNPGLRRRQGDHQAIVVSDDEATEHLTQVRFGRMLTEWPRWFPNCEPIAYLMRDAFPDRWVRFHSLPGSKRYPDDETEYATVLERHNTVLGELARPKYEVVLLMTGYSESSIPGPCDRELEQLDPGASYWRTVAYHELIGDAEPNYWHIYARSREWYSGVFDSLMRTVVDDLISNVMIVAPDCRWLLHPYDGGMDLILESSAERDRLKDKYSGWLSAALGGL